MIGWVTDLAASEAYFKDERLDSTFWDSLTATSGGRDEKTAVLKQAYNRIRMSRDFDIPINPTAAQLEKLTLAQCEMAYYLAQHLADEDRRKGLQAQGVADAGIVKERYQGEGLDQLPIPAVVRDILNEFEYVEQPFHAADLDRGEDEPVGENVVGRDDLDY